MKLSNRLLTIASKVPINSIVADIGTDHAYIPVFLVKNKISQKVIACDINKGPIERAQNHINQNRVAKNIETRLGSGLTILNPNEVDTVIIAGMGGVLIADILSASTEILDTTKRLVLQPMIGQEVVREWLYKNNFKIIDESLAKEEDKIYEIIVAEHGDEKVKDEIYYEIGKKLIENKDTLLEEFLNKKIKKNKKIITFLQGENTEKAIVRRKECEDKLKSYMKLLEKIK